MKEYKKRVISKKKTTMAQTTAIKLSMPIVFLVIMVIVYVFIYLPQQNKSVDASAVNNSNTTQIPNTSITNNTIKNININDEIILKKEEIPSLDDTIEQEEINAIASIPNVNIPEPITRDTIIGIIIKPLPEIQNDSQIIIKSGLPDINDIPTDDDLIVTVITKIAVPNTLTIKGSSTVNSINERFLGTWKTFGENKVGVQLNNPSMESTSIPYNVDIYPAHLTTSDIGKVYWKDNILFPKYTSLLFPFTKDSLKGFLFVDVETINLPNPNLLLQNTTNVMKRIELPLSFLTNQNSDAWFININDDIRTIPKEIRIQRWDNKRFIGTPLTTELTFD